MNPFRPTVANVYSDRVIILSGDKSFEIKDKLLVNQLENLVDKTITPVQMTTSQNNRLFVEELTLDASEKTCTLSLNLTDGRCLNFEFSSENLTAH